LSVDLGRRPRVNQVCLEDCQAVSLQQSMIEVMKVLFDSA
jgi:hypothetical protein